jgi:hypothetical protein
MVGVLVVKLTIPPNIIKQHLLFNLCNVSMWLNSLNTSSLYVVLILHLFPYTLAYR